MDFLSTELRWPDLFPKTQLLAVSSEWAGYLPQCIHLLRKSLRKGLKAQRNSVLREFRASGVHSSQPRRVNWAPLMHKGWSDDLVKLQRRIDFHHRHTPAVFVCHGQLECLVFGNLPAGELAVAGSRRTP